MATYIRQSYDIVSVPPHDGFLVDRVDIMAWMSRLMEWLLTVQCG